MVAIILNCSICRVSRILNQEWFEKSSEEIGALGFLKTTTKQENGALHTILFI